MLHMRVIHHRLCHPKGDMLLRKRASPRDKIMQHKQRSPTLFELAAIWALNKSARYRTFLTSLASSNIEGFAAGVSALVSFTGKRYDLKCSAKGSINEIHDSAVNSFTKKTITIWLAVVCCVSRKYFPFFRSSYCHNLVFSHYRPYSFAQ